MPDGLPIAASLMPHHNTVAKVNEMVLTAVMNKANHTPEAKSLMAHMIAYAKIMAGDKVDWISLRQCNVKRAEQLFVEMCVAEYEAGFGPNQAMQTGGVYDEIMKSVQQGKHGKPQLRDKLETQLQQMRREKKGGFNDAIKFRDTGGAVQIAGK